MQASVPTSNEDIFPTDIVYGETFLIPYPDTFLSLIIGGLIKWIPRRIMKNLLKQTFSYDNLI